MWSRAEMKRMARERLSRYHWYGVLVCLIASLLGVSSSGSLELNYEEESMSWEDIQHYLSHPETLAYIQTALIIGLIAVVLGLLFSILVTGPVEIGYCRYFMMAREVQTPVSEMFAPFRRNYSNAVVVMFMRDLSIFLWSLLFIIPGIIKAYSYRMVPYLLAENPDMDYHRALQLSASMMDGYKMTLFVLDLSFLGWDILSSFTLNILGVLYVNPYKAATHAEYYAAIRYNAFGNRLTDPYELPFVFT